VSLGLYFDQHVPGPVAEGLRRRGIDVLTTEEDGAKSREDQTLLDRAAVLGRVMVTNDNDFLSIAAAWMAEDRLFAGLVHLTTQRIPFGKAIEDLELIARVYSETDMLDRVEHLPL
jgi:predicted nuclease of predicted toxin-antitoxin system